MRFNISENTHKYDEWKYAEMLAEKFGIDLYQEVFNYIYWEIGEFNKAILVELVGGICYNAFKSLE